MSGLACHLPIVASASTISHISVYHVRWAAGWSDGAQEETLLIIVKIRALLRQAAELEGQ